MNNWLGSKAASYMIMAIPPGTGVRRLFLYVAAVVFGIVGSAGAQTSDTAAPVVATVGISPAKVDTTAASQQVVLTASVSDDLSGFQYGCFYFLSPSSQQQQGVCLTDPVHLLSGSETNGVYRGTIVIPRFAEAGTWRFYSLYVIDDVGNFRNFSEADIAAAGLAMNLEVVSVSDITPPTVNGLDIEPSAVDVSNGQQSVDVFVQVSDDLGDVASVCMFLNSPGGMQYQYSCYQSTDGEGTYQITLTIPQFAEAGTWHVTSVDVSDSVGNYRYYSEAELSEADFPTTIQVASTPSDTAVPTLAGFALKPTAVNTATADAVVTAVATVQDDLSGVSAVCVYFTSPSGLQQQRVGCLSFVSGEGLVTFEGPITFPQFSEAGLWRAYLYVYDNVGNYAYIDEAALIALGFPTTVTVASNTPEMPAIFDIEAGDGRLTVSFFPGADSGSAITNYKYSIDDGQTFLTREPAATTSPLVITGLTNGVTYQVRLRAVNANGDGTPSLAEPGTPRAPAGVILDGFDPGADGTVYALAVQPDGKILVGGAFSSLGGGGSGQFERDGIGRLNPDGSLDQTFDAGRINDLYGEVRAIALQPDGKILVGGFEIAGNRNIVRLNADGSLDPTFQAAADSFVYAVAVQPDGRILVGGSFSTITVGGVAVPRRGIARLNSDGSVDPGFDPGLDPDGWIEALTLQPDGRILIGGNFFRIGELVRDNLARLESNGTVDTTFDTGIGSDVESFVYVTTLTLQADGRILVGGRFQVLTTATGSTSRANIARLNADGSIDTAFVPPPEYQFDSDFLPAVETILALPNGQVLAGGYSLAMRVPGEPGHHIVRYNANGSVDTTFDAMADWIVQEMVALRSGPILVGGDFEFLGGLPRIHLGRIDIGIPGIPVLGTVTPGNGQLSVAVTAPASGFPITNYEYSTDGGVTWTTRTPASPASPVVITGLTNGTTYTVALRAATASGVGYASATVQAVPVTTPAAPAISAITPGNAQLAVAFSAPGADGGAAITNYEYSTDAGATWTARSPASIASPLIVPGLANGVTYQVALRAVNVAGPGAASAAVPGQPSTTPAAPLVTGVTPGNGQLTVVFIGGGDGGRPLTTYEFSTDSGATWQPRVPAGTASPLVIAGLTNGTTYGLQIRAVNANGAGAASPTVPAIPQATLDETVDTFNPGADGEVRALVIQADGKIVVGGQFTRLGENATLPRTNLGRLNADGTADATFNPPNIGPSSIVSALLVQTDGRIVLAGDGPDPTGERTYVARLHADGVFDGGFQGAANGPIHALAQEADGRLLIGGDFTLVGLNNEWPRLRLARLNADGTADPSFNPGVNGIVNTIAVQPDGRILIGGSFTSVGSVPRSNLARLNPDGSLDLGFVGAASGPTASAVEVPGSFVATLWIQQDGRILVGGRFNTLGGGSAVGVRQNVGRLHPDGTLDTTFDAGLYSSSSSAFVESVLALPTRRILIGGVAVAAPHHDGSPRHLARLHPDGTLDADFEPRADQRVRALAVQPDGKVVVGGQFTTIGGNIRYRIARLSGSGPSSPATPSTPLPFTDPSLVAGTTPLRAVHITELRTRINGLRQRFGLAPVSWTDPVLSGVPARALHVIELRTALLQAFDAALPQGITAPRPVFAEAALGAGIPIRALHIQQLRDAVVLLEGS